MCISVLQLYDHILSNFIIFVCFATCAIAGLWWGGRGRRGSCKRKGRGGVRLCLQHMDSKGQTGRTQETGTYHEVFSMSITGICLSRLPWYACLGILSLPRRLAVALLDPKRSWYDDE